MQGNCCPGLRIGRQAIMARRRLPDRVCGQCDYASFRLPISFDDVMCIFYVNIYKQKNIN